jgi:hypothetical protein
MLRLAEVFQVALELLSLPFGSKRRKGAKTSQTEDAQRAALLIIFGAFVVFGGIIWLTNFLRERQ